MVEGILRKTDALIARKYRELFVPTLLSLIALYMGNILNGVIVGNLISLKAMTAIYASMPLNQIATAIAMMLSAGSAGMIAIAAGAQENDKADRIFSSVLTMSFITAALTIIFLLPFTRELASVLSAVFLQPTDKTMMTAIIVGGAFFGDNLSFIPLIIELMKADMKI